jgi:hypothetical protein
MMLINQTVKYVPEMDSMLDSDTTTDASEDQK